MVVNSGFSPMGPGSELHWWSIPKSHRLHLSVRASTRRVFLGLEQTSLKSTPTAWPQGPIQAYTRGTLGSGTDQCLSGRVLPAPNGHISSTWSSTSGILDFKEMFPLRTWKQDSCLRNTLVASLQRLRFTYSQPFTRKPKKHIPLYSFSLCQMHFENHRWVFISYFSLATYEVWSIL